jgi:uncharacterized protein (TIGR03437 family)
MRKIILSTAFGLVLSHLLGGQSYTIQTIAGTGWNIPGTLANLSSIQGVAVDGGGNVFLALSDYSAVVRLDSTGQLSLVAGNGTSGFSGDGGPATLAQLGSPTGVAVDGAGNVYVADTLNDRIRMVSNGKITTIAGNGTYGFSGDNGPATGAELGFVAGFGGALAADLAGNVYLGDSDRIRKVSNGIITTVAGGGFSYGDNIPANTAALSAAGIAVGAAGAIYFSDPCSNRIRKVSNGIITTLAGNGAPNFFACAAPVAGGNGTATNISLDTPGGVAVDTAGNVYFMEGAQTGGTFPGRARKITNGIVTTVAGGYVGPPVGSAVSDNVPATSAFLSAIGGIAVDTAGDLYIADYYFLPTAVSNGVALEAAQVDGRLRKVSNGIITTIAGSFGDTPPGVPALTVQLNLPASLAVDSLGNLYIADSSNNIIRGVSSEMIATLAGNRLLGSEGDGGPATNANLWNPQSVAVDPSGNLYIGDTGNGSIREVSRGIISTAVASVGEVAGMVVDAAGNLYFADQSGNTIDELSNGAVTVMAGDGTLGFGGDNGPAATARMASPSAIALDGEGNIYFADTGNQRVREISHGVITTVAGNGTAGYSGDNGPATSAQLDFSAPLCVALFSCPYPVYQFPPGIAMDSSGNLYIADSANQLIRKVSGGIITTIAGTGSPGFGGDGGLAVNAQFNNPSGIAIDAQGKIYVSDASNGRVRVLAPCVFSVGPYSAQSPVSGGSFTITVQTDAPCPWAVSGLPNWINEAAPVQSSGSESFMLMVAANPGASRVANIIVAGQPITLSQAATSGFAPVILAVINAAGGNPAIAPNTWVEINGLNLAPAGDVRVWQTPDFIGNQLPVGLDGVSVQVNGENVYVYYISSNQINILTPADLGPGPVQVKVIVDGFASAAFTAQAQQVSPSLFAFGGGPYVTAVHADGSLIGPANLYPGSSTPAKPGEIILIFANGFGPTSSPVINGSESQAGSLPILPAIRIGGITTSVKFAGLISPGLYQFNVVVPASALDGDNAIMASYNGAITQPGTLLTIQH